MAKAKRKLTPAQRKVAMRNLAKARTALRKKLGLQLTPAKGRGSRPSKKKLKAQRRRYLRLTDAQRKALGYTKEQTMAAKKKKKGSKKGSRRRSGARNIMSGFEWENMLGAAAYGAAERQVATKGDEAILKKVPLFYDGIGYAGCLGILAHIIGKNVGGIVGKAARHLAAGTLDVAAYKLAKNGKLYESKAEAEAALAGYEDDDLSGDDDEEVGWDMEGIDDEVGYGADGIS